MNSKAVPILTPVAKAPSKRKHAEKKELVGEDSPKKARSDAGSVRGGGHVKTTATDTAMVRAALTSIHRRHVCVARYGVWVAGVAVSPTNSFGWAGLVFQVFRFRSFKLQSESLTI